MKRSLAIALAVTLLPAGCGYHLVHDVADPLGPFTVASGPIRVPDAALAAAAEEGARAELSRAGQLAGRGAPAEVVVEVIRVDEASAGVAMVRPDTPLARGVRVSVTGRAKVVPRGGSAAERETDEVQATEVAAAAASAGLGAATRDEAGRRAARRLGEMLVRRLLGVPEPGEP